MVKSWRMEMVVHRAGRGSSRFVHGRMGNVYMGA